VDEENVLCITKVENTFFDSVGGNFADWNNAGAESQILHGLKTSNS
jgi:hypothetical protein